MKSDEFYEGLDEGIREAVRELHAAGIKTTDSGDGSKWCEMSCASVPHPHIVATTWDNRDAADTALIALERLGDGWEADVSYRLVHEEGCGYVSHPAVIFLEKPAPDSHEKQMRRMVLGFQADVGLLIGPTPTNRYESEGVSNGQD